MRERKARKRLSKTLPLMTGMKGIFTDSFTAKDAKDVEEETQANPEASVLLVCYVSNQHLYDFGVPLSTFSRLMKKPDVKERRRNQEIDDANSNPDLRSTQLQCCVSSRVSS
jgi:hypothetical protein